MEKTRTSRAPGCRGRGRAGGRGDRHTLCPSSRAEVASRDRGPSTLTLWRRCAEGGTDTEWAELHRRLVDRLRRWILRGLGGRARCPRSLELDDLVQEVYCRLLAGDARALRECRADNEAELMAYLARICNSVLVSSHRRFAALKRRAPLEASWRELMEEVPASSPDPEERALIREARRMAVGCASAACPSAQRRQRFVLDQVLFVGYTSEELARAVGVSASAIDTAVSRARRRAEARGIPFPRRKRRPSPPRADLR